MFCSCGQQNLVNLIGGSVNKYQEFVLGREKKSQENKILLCECFAGKHQNTHTEEKLVLVLSFHKPPMKLSRFCEYNGTNFPKKEELSLKKLPQIVSKEVPLHW